MSQMPILKIKRYDVVEHCEYWQEADVPAYYDTKDLYRYAAQLGKCASKPNSPIEAVTLIHPRKHPTK